MTEASHCMQYSQDHPSKNRFDEPSHYLEVLGSKMHYLDEGVGDPLVFLHGIPTWSYLWRNVIPDMTEVGRCIAPDLIGMGRSDKPSISYRIFDHIDYIEHFLDRLKLERITLVLHGWGSLVGFEYARCYPDKVKAIAFVESHVRLLSEWDQLSLPLQQRVFLLGDRDTQYKKVVEENYFLNHFLPKASLRKLTNQEVEHYHRPFSEIESRQVLWQYFCDFPWGGQHSDVSDLIHEYSKALQASPVPKLMVYAIPGFMTTIETVMWCKEHLPSLTLVDFDQALHFPQEMNPHKLADILKRWYLGL